jgi:hypothetical protein
MYLHSKEFNKFLLTVGLVLAAPVVATAKLDADFIAHLRNVP